VAQADDGKDSTVAVPNWVPKDLKPDFRRAEQQGWTFEKTTKGGRAKAPDGENMVHFHLTPGRNATRLVLSRMRKHGYDPEQDD
jgi:hypothetical protein